jgi:hypothetical protein
MFGSGTRREASARKTLEDAHADLAALERARDEARLAELRSDIRAAEEGATARAKEVAAEFCAVGAAQQERINAANTLVHRLEGPGRNHHSDLIHIGGDWRRVLEFLPRLLRGLGADDGGLAWGDADWRADRISAGDDRGEGSGGGGEGRSEGTRAALRARGGGPARGAVAESDDSRRVRVASLLALRCGGADLQRAIWADDVLRGARDDRGSSRIAPDRGRGETAGRPAGAARGVRVGGPVPHAARDAGRSDLGLALADSRSTLRNTALR